MQRSDGAEGLKQALLEPMTISSATESWLIWCAGQKSGIAFHCACLGWTGSRALDGFGTFLLPVPACLSQHWLWWWSLSVGTLVKVGYFALWCLTVTFRQGMQASFILFLNQNSLPGEEPWKSWPDHSDSPSHGSFVKSLNSSFLP